MVELEIDGKKVTAAEGDTIIEAADVAGIYIPRFCYHKKLSIAANCRMCLVEVEKVGKPLPACATPVTQEMKVFTQSKKALAAQRAVMEFLLINHPLDCPICDQGGVCELQDLAMGYGTSYSYYEQTKRSVFKEDLGPLIATGMTRCIHCTRCVRFGEEIAGLRELGATGRGEDMQIGTYVKHFIKSEMSGNVIDICPVGALTSKPFEYSGRGWELQEHKSIAVHDCVGSNIYIHTRGHQLRPERDVMKVVPRDNEDVNENWISDRDRFSYEGLKHSDRILKPKIKQNGRWVEAEWERTLVEIADKTRGIVQQHGAEQIAALVSPNSTVEELYCLQKLMRALGSNNIDHRIRQQDFTDQDQAPAFPSCGVNIAEIEHLSSILLVGSNVRFEQPLISHRINKAAQDDDAHVMAINPIDYRFVYPLTAKIISADMILSLAEVAKAIADQQQKNIAELNNISPSESAKIIADNLISRDNAAIFLGAVAINHPQASVIRSLVRLIGELSGAAIGVLTEGANSAGAWLAGAVPHREAAYQAAANPGLTAKELLTDQPVKVYYLLNLEPAMDCAYAAKALKTLDQASMVVCLTPFVSSEMQQYADFILPITSLGETSGTFVNTEGKWQSFAAASVPHGAAKPAWKILRVLANLMQLDGFNYVAEHEVLNEIQVLVDGMPEYQAPQINLALPQHNNELMRIGTWPIYRGDNLVRRAKALQATQFVVEPEINTIKINQKTAQQLQLQHGEAVTATQGESRVTLPLVIDNSLADNVVLLPSGLKETTGFGEAFAAIKLTKGTTA
jgi:NADH-quinone oxidoreductase subunit G